MTGFVQLLLSSTVLFVDEDEPLYDLFPILIPSLDLVLMRRKVSRHERPTRSFLQPQSNPNRSFVAHQVQDSTPRRRDLYAVFLEVRSEGFIVRVDEECDTSQGFPCDEGISPRVAFLFVRVCTFDRLFELVFVQV